MGYYDLTKAQRIELLNKIKEQIEIDIVNNRTENIRGYSSDNDTYIRKNVYLVLGRLYRDNIEQRKGILKTLEVLLFDKNEKIT